MPQRARKVRPYTGDFLTFPKGGNWTLQFRVPEHLRGLPPFGNKVIFKKSLRTKDRGLALKLKDEFLQEVGFYEPDLDRDRVRAEKTMKAPDFYFEHLNALDTSQGVEPLLVLSEEISGLIMDVQQDNGSQKQVDKLKAQLAATERAIDEVSAGGKRDAPQPCMN